MSIYKEFANLRPMTPVSRLYEIIGTKWKPPSNGKMTVNGCFSVRIDTEGYIGEISFKQGFPSMKVEGLQVGMHVEKVFKSHSFVFDCLNEFKTLEVFRAPLASGDEIIVNISTGLGAGGMDTKQRLHYFTIHRPGRIYGPSKSQFEATMVVTKGVKRRGDDEALRDWAWESSDASMRIYVDWLLQATAEERHQSALNWNYDNGLDPLFWIIRQKDCEKATALAIFYKFDLGRHLQIRNSGVKPTNDDEGVGLVEEIASKFSKGFYKASTIYYDGTEYYGNVARDVAEFIPEAVRQEVGYRVVPADSKGYTEGIPDHIF